MIPRPRFTLRTLLIAVALCAIGLAIHGIIPKPELLPTIRYGDQQSRILQRFGQPSKKTLNINGTENWIYFEPIKVRDSSGKEITLNIQPRPKWDWPKYGYDKWLVITFHDGSVVGAVVADTWDGRPQDFFCIMHPDLQL